ncbi:permease [Streptococcus sp. SL1232]|uniref:permease n=1 Tax=Streptococcus vicugnae TaxID=2740579 RepID=UPI0018F39BCF|nr:permease [Streptococcus vicugnae]MBJ7541412.1 permease [Streptococcus vicugnae]
MENKKVSIVLDQAIIDQLDLDKGQQLKAELYNDKLVLQKEESPKQGRLSSWVLIISTIVLCCLFYAASSIEKMDQILLVGDYSIITFLIGFGGILGMTIFTTTLIRNRTVFLGGIKVRVFWRMLPVIVASFAVILLLALLGFGWLLEQIFTGASFDKFTSTLILGVSVYVVSLFWGQIAEQIRATWLTTVFTIIMVSGVFVAMASNRTLQWWHFNLSFLGTQAAKASWQFNLTLILSALILVALVDYLFVALSEKYGKNWKLTAIRVMLTILGIDLGAVGFFPNDASSHLLHTRVAGYLVLIIIALIISVKWLLPEVTRDFLVMSYAIGGMLVGLEIAFQVVHYLSLTAFELSAFMLAFAWLIRLITHLEALLLPETKVMTVTLE